MTARDYKTGNAWQDLHWNNPPAPLNPDYDPRAKQRFAEVTASMEADGYYKAHSREECAAEWRRRYEKMKGGQRMTRRDWRQLLACCLSIDALICAVFFLFR